MWTAEVGQVTDLERLRDPFPSEQIGKLPRVWCKRCRDARPAACGENGHKIAKCDECGQKGTTAHLHLDYVGHAEVTHRLLDVDPGWYWEPLAFDADGLPALKREGKQVSLWIKLTVGGVTRLGVGIVDAGKDELDKQLISDALRNAAMRFGVALDLWAKSELDHTTAGEGASHEAVQSEPSSVQPSEGGDPPAAPPQEQQAPTPSSEQPSPASEAEPPTSAPGRSQSGGGRAVGEVGSPAASDNDAPPPEVQRLISDLNGLPLEQKALAIAEKRRLEIRNFVGMTEDDETFKLLRAKVTELKQAVPA